MPRWITALVFICLSTGQLSLAQELRVWDRNVQVHGFFSQGSVRSTENNWLTMDTSEGSSEMTDMGLNMSSQLTDKFRVGGQVYDRNLGQLGQFHPSLDWGLADYRFTQWLGIRAGKAKTTLGLLNNSQDLDFLHVFALLPQGAYPTDLRDTTIAHTGGDVYGMISLRHPLGEISYTGYAGLRRDSICSGYPYLIQQYHLSIQSMKGPQYGADVPWNTPLTGLVVGGSRMNQCITASGAFVNLLDPLLERPRLRARPKHIGRTSFTANTCCTAISRRRRQVAPRHNIRFWFAPPICYAPWPWRRRGPDGIHRHPWD
jgi:hypothetical protein